MEKSRTFQDLIVWQKAHQLVLKVYEVTQEFPKEELYGITSQIRRYSVSIAANVAEGFKRKSQADKARFFNISEGSLDETNYFLILSKDLGFVNSNSTLIDLTEEVGRLLYSYKQAILNSKS